MSEKIASLLRKRVAKEKGVVKKEWGGRLSIALTYPNFYRVGMSNLGFQVVYDLLNSSKDVVAERAFLPEEHELSLHLGAGKGLLSLESQSPLRKFDIIAFSLSFENDYPNILKILDIAKIPLLRKDRDETYPLIMAGGITTFLNPEPLADFFDLFLIGEAEASLDEFMNLIRERSHDTNSRAEILEILARDCLSVYVPSLYEIEYHRDGTIGSRFSIGEKIKDTTVLARVESKKFSVNCSTLLTPDTEFGSRLLIELGRGCSRACRFCAAGYIYRPPRLHEKEKLISRLRKEMTRTENIGLLSSSVLDTPGIEDIAREIIQNRCHFSVSSLRADLLTCEILDQLKEAGQRSLSIAPETGSERLRRVINKHLTNKRIFEAVTKIARVGDFSLRLYFLIGLPTETMEDVVAIHELVKSIKHHMIKESRDRGKMGAIRLSINSFIPKPNTPFQWFPMESESSLKEKQKWLRSAFAKEGGVKLSLDVPKWAYVQALLSLGDRRVGPVLMRAHEYNGDWPKAFRHSDVNPDFFVYRPKDLNENLPWDFIETGIRKDHLKKEYKLALMEKESDICRVGECGRCGVCEKTS